MCKVYLMHIFFKKACLQFIFKHFLDDAKTWSFPACILKGVNMHSGYCHLNSNIINAFVKKKKALCFGLKFQE